jgi:ribosomal protein S18 acetylase RimI-like enzyme
MARQSLRPSSSAWSADSLIVPDAYALKELTAQVGGAAWDDLIALLPTLDHSPYPAPNAKTVNHALFAITVEREADSTTGTSAAFAGYVLVGSLSTNQLVQKELIVLSLYVHPAHRKQRLGRTLLVAALRRGLGSTFVEENAAHTVGASCIERVRVQTLADRDAAAYHLYESLGFTLRRNIRGYYPALEPSSPPRDGVELVLSIGTPLVT